MVTLRAFIALAAVVGVALSSPTPRESFTVGHYERSANGIRCAHDLCVNEERGLMIGQVDLEGRCAHDICVPAHQARRLDARDLAPELSLRWIAPSCCTNSCWGQDRCEPPCSVSHLCRRDEVAVLHHAREYDLGSRDNVVVNA